MRYKLLAVGTLIVGYVAGVFFGYRAAVVDYVENDADTLKSMAADIYPSIEEGGGQGVPEEVREAMEEGYKKKQDESDEGSRAFQ